jgi:ABC-type glycerol-3-phosphate transport system substrate-binding protein
MKTLTVILMILLIAVSFAFAGGGQQGGAAGGSSGSGGSGLPYEGVTINLMADNRSEFDKMLQLYPEFEKRTGIKINWMQLQETPLRSKTGLELAAPSTDIDVIMMDFTFVAKYSAAGYLEPLDAHLAKIPTYKASDFMKPFNDACSYNGSLFAVPINQDSSILYYRADIFKELGISVPKTFEDLENACKKIKAARSDIYPIAMRGARGAGLNEWVWPSFLWGFGGQYYDFKTYKATLNSPESIRSLEYYANLQLNYGPPGIADYTNWETQADMMQGKIAMMVDSASIAIRCEDPVNSKVAGKLGYDVVPGLPGKVQPGFYAWTLAIPKNSRNKAAAAEFIAWLASPDIAIKVGWSAPNQALKQVYNIPPFPGYAGGKNLYDVMTESLALANPDFRPRINEGSEISTRVSEAISAVLSKQTSAKAALDACNADVDKILKDAGYQK